MFLEIINDKIQELIGKSAVDKWQWMKEFSQYTLHSQFDERFHKGLFPKNY